VRGNGLEFRVSVNCIMKFIYTLYKCKYKNKYIYMVLHNCVKQCKKCDEHDHVRYIYIYMHNNNISVKIQTCKC
jgi:hypothetical protein